jgi:hypothetical protein
MKNSANTNLRGRWFALVTVLVLSLSLPLVGCGDTTASKQVSPTDSSLNVHALGYATGTTTRISVDSNGNEANGGSFSPWISENGRFVSFESSASNLVPGDTNGFSDIFVHDRLTGETTRVSVDSSGNQANNDSFFSSISGDGCVVAFWSKASNLVAGDTNNEGDSFVHDCVTGQTTRVSVDSVGNEGIFGSGPRRPFISVDGHYVAFSSISALVSGDTNGTADVFVHDLLTGQTSRVSVDSLGNQSNAWSDLPSISADNRFVVFRSGASNLVPGDTNNVCDGNGDLVFDDNCPDVFVHDRQTGQTTRINLSSGGDQANGESYAFLGNSISGNARYVGFSSDATNLVAGDTNGIRDFFVHDRLTNETTRVSVDSDGNQGTVDTIIGVLMSSNAAISRNGRFITFNFDPDNMVPGDTNDTTDVFVHDMTSGETTRVSVDSNGNEGNRSSIEPSISGDGRFVAFWSNATNLVLGDNNDVADVFIHDRNRAPDCGAGFASPSELWPPNHAFRDVSVEGVTDLDGDAVAVTITSIFQDEPVNGKGSGNKCSDGVIAGGNAARLRAERDGKGDGRVYHLTFSAEDALGAECTATVTVCVSHDQADADCGDQGSFFDSLVCD